MSHDSSRQLTNFPDYKELVVLERKLIVLMVVIESSRIGNITRLFVIRPGKIFEWFLPVNGISRMVN